MQISKYWFRTRELGDGTEFTRISLEKRFDFKTKCICDTCRTIFFRTGKAAKYGLQFCDLCHTTKYGHLRFTKEVREKISVKVSKAYSDPIVRLNKSIITKRLYEDENNKKKQREGCIKRSADPAYRQKLKETAVRGEVHAINTSCGKQHIKREEFNGFITNRDIRERELCKTTVGKECLMKANFKCDICNKEGNLHAHHMNGWHWAIEERFDIDNLVALCHGCHGRFHSIYGAKNNTKQQYAEFRVKKRV